MLEKTRPKLLGRVFVFILRRNGAQIWAGQLRIFTASGWSMGPSDINWGAAPQFNETSTLASRFALEINLRDGVQNHHILPDNRIKNRPVGRVDGFGRG